MKFDVVIAGAGPAGLFAARELEKDFSVAVFEKSHFLGSYGNRIVNRTTFSKLGVGEGCIVRPIDDITFVSPSMYEITVREKKRGFVISKGGVQEDIAGQLTNTHLFLNSPVDSVDAARGTLVSNGNRFGYDFLIAADGWNSSLRSLVTDEKPITVNCYYEVVPKGAEKTSCIISNAHTSGFYGWSIDLGKEVEIGMGCLGDPFRSYGRFLRYFFGSGKKSSRKVFGFIPRTFVDRKVSGNVALIGDSTGGEPLMGSSMHKSIDEARLVSEAIKRGNMNSYESMWKERFSAEFSVQQKVRDRLDSMDDSEIDNFFSVKRQLKRGGLVNDVFRDLLEK